MTFRSKVDAWLATVLVLAVGAQLWAALFVLASGTSGRWVAVALLLIGPALILWILVTTYYVVEGSELLVRCGPLRVRIPIDQISGIQQTRNALSSPALSLDRLAITYSNGRKCMVSPKDQGAFIEALRSHGARAA